MSSHNFIKQELNENNTKDMLKSEPNVSKLKEFQQLTRAVGTQAQLQYLLPSDMYAKISAIEKSQQEHEILFQSLSTIIDELSDRYNGGNFSPDRISSEGYASKNTNTSAEDISEVSSNAETSSISNDSIKIENEDNNDINDNVNIINNTTSTTATNTENITEANEEGENEDEKEHYIEEDYDDTRENLRKSQRKIRPKIFSDMIYENCISADDRISIKSENNDKSFDISLLSRSSSLISPDLDNSSISSNRYLKNYHQYKQQQQQHQHNNNMIQLGPHGTLIDIMDYNTIPWESASAATRKLLNYVFDIETLATHSLTGRPSPAFFGRERPLKNQLDQEKIADIVHIVINKTGASERDIRAAITTKCADTTKMYKIKQSRIKKLSL